MALDNVNDNICEGFSKIEVISSPEMTVENENRLLDKVELWSSSDNDGPNRKKAKNVLRRDKKKTCVECCVLEQKLRRAEELLNHACTLMSGKNREMFSKKIDLWENDKGRYY